MSDTATQMRFASAISDDDNARTAVDQILLALDDQLDAPVDLIVYFATPDHRDAFSQIHDRLDTSFRPRHVIGATVQGVIGVRRELEHPPGIAVLAASLPGARITTFNYGQFDWSRVIDNPDALRDQMGNVGGDPRAIVLLADPFSTPMPRLLPTLNHCWPDTPVVGGMASGSDEPEGNRLMIDGVVLTQGAVGFLLGGDIAVQTTVSQGCRPIGQPVVITKAKRHLVMELGGHKALKVVEELLREITDIERQMVQDRGLFVGRVINEYQDTFHRGDFLIRNLVGADQDAGYIAINDAQVHVGQTLQFHVRDADSARDDFDLLLQEQVNAGPVAGALLFSCNGRGMRLFDEPDTDANLLHHALGDVPVAGFFAAGEIGPVGGPAFLHGHTASLVTFRPT